MTKYDALGEYLQRSNREVITLSFEQIESILGFNLPKSASSYRQWWANGGHTQAYGWMSYGYEICDVHLLSKKASFRRIERGLPFQAEKKASSIPKPKTSNHDRMPVNSQQEVIRVCGYEFTFLQELKPARDTLGRVIEYAPQKQYSNPHGKRLNKYGGGMFCEFSINAGRWSGVYLWIVDNEIIYIGETKDLAQRFNNGYGKIAGINCYMGGQITNCKMNKVVLELSKQGKTVKLFFHETVDYKKVELDLLKSINTRYNVKDN